MSPASENLCRSVAALAVLVGCLVTASVSHAVELKVLASRAMRPALSLLIPQFERTSGIQVTTVYAGASALVKEIEAGEIADLAILSEKKLELLQEEDKIVEDSLTSIAKREFGVIIRKGAAKPDLSTVHALKQTLMDAKLIASGNPRSSASGEYLARLIERLRISDAIKPKIKIFSSGAAALKAVANGEADLGVGVVTAADRSGTELAGLLPAQAKKSKSYVIGILTSSNQTKEAAAFASFISSPASLAVIKSKGLDPP